MGAFGTEAAYPGYRRADLDSMFFLEDHVDIVFPPCIGGDDDGVLTHVSIMFDGETMCHLAISPMRVKAGMMVHVPIVVSEVFAGMPRDRVAKS